MRQPGKTHDRIIISARQAEVLRAAVVSVHALLWMGHPPGIGCVKGRDLAARSPAITPRPTVLSVGHVRCSLPPDLVDHRPGRQGSGWGNRVAVAVVPGDFGTLQ